MRTMGMIRSFIRGLEALRHKRARNGEIEEELHSFLQHSIEDKIRCGMTRESAIRSARAEIGGVAAVRQKVWSAGWESTAEMLWHDLIYTFRRLARTPGVVFAVVLSIGLGIAANATIFSLVSKFVLAPAPVGDPKTLTTVYRTFNNGTCCNALPMPVYRDLRDQAKSFSGMAAYFELVPASLGGNGEPERVWGQATTANYFDVAELRMAQGRGFTTDEERAQVIVLGYQLWQHRFNGDPAIVNRVVTLGGQTYTVVGVAPKGFRGIDLLLDPQFWVPLGSLPHLTTTAPDPESRTMQWLRVSARLRPGATLTEAGAEMQLLGQRFAAQHPETDKGDNFHLEPAGSLPPRDKKSIQVFLAALLVVVLLVLCIACANVANLLLALGAKRQREMAVRQALGATRTQLVRQLLLESVLLSLCGGLVGIALSVWATYLLSSFKLPAPMPLDVAVRVDWRVLLYTFGLSLAVGVLCGFVPAWTASRPSMPSALKGEESLARPGRAWSLRNLLVVVQISISFVLLCGAGLFLRSLQSASRIDTGFRPSGVVMLGIDPPTQSYTPMKTIQLLRTVRQQILALPGVLNATVTDGVPLSGGHRSDGFVAEGRPSSQGAPIVEMYMAGPGYFETLGIPQLSGRELGIENPTAPKVTIVNEELVRQFFPGQNPIGRRIVDGDVPYEIVGVVKNTKSRTIGEDQRPIMYRSFEQTIEKDPSTDGYQFMVRYQGDPAVLVDAVRREINAQDASLAVFNVQTMDEHLHDALFLPRLVETLFTVFGSIGVLLASVGLYGVVNYSVSQRTKEIGIRMALGARTAAVQKLIVRGGMWLFLVSSGLGLPIALAGAKLATSMLYGVRPYDVATFTAVPIVLFVITFVACWIPARRASRVDPMVALRVD
jgi:predicted permease